MKNVAEFTIVGRVATIRQFDKVMKVSVASNYPVKKADGTWGEDTHWNQVTVFSERLQGTIDAEIGRGDLIELRGRVRQGSFERDGERVYSTDLIVTQVELKAKTSARAPQREAA